MKLVTATTTLAVLISLSQGRPQTFEGVVTLPGRNGQQAPPASLAGTVVSEATGEPLVGARVTLSRHFGNAVLALLSDEAGTVIAPVTTNDQGGFSFEGIVAAAYDLTVQRDGYLTQKLGTRTFGSGADITLSAGQQIRDFKVRLVRTARLEGQVRIEADTPAAGIPLQLIPLDSLKRGSGLARDLPVAQSTTAADGTYHLGDFAPGGYVLLAGFPLALNGEPARSFATEINISNAEAQTLDFSLDTKGGYSIRGKVSLSTPAPPTALDMTIRTTWRAGNPLAPRVGVNIPYSYDARDGTFEIPGLFPGIYEITASAKVPQIPSDFGVSLGAVLKAYGGCGTIPVVISRADVTGLDLTVVQCQ